VLVLFFLFSISVASYATNGMFAATTNTAGSFPNLNQFGIRNCNNDYLVIPGGVNQGQETSPDFGKENPNLGDRFCGDERLRSLTVASVPDVGTETPSPLISATLTEVNNQVIFSSEL